MSADLEDPRFTDETAAREALETLVWPNGPVCPRCGNADQVRIAALTTKSARPGLRYCDECKGQFTATVGTIFERSKIPLTKWWLAMHLMVVADDEMYVNLRWFRGQARLRPQKRCVHAR